MSFLSTTQRTHLSAALRKPIWTLLLRFLYRPWYLLTWLLWLAHTPAQAQLFDPSDPRVIGLKEYLERPCGPTLPENSPDCVNFSYRPGTFGLKVVEALFSDLVVGRPEFYGSATYRNIVRASLNDTYNAAFTAGEPVTDFNYLESVPFLRGKFLSLAQTRILEPLSVLGADRLGQIEMDGIEKARMILVILSIDDLFKINKELALEAFDNYYDSFKTPVAGTAIDSEVTYQWIAAIRNRFNQLNNTCTNPTVYPIGYAGNYCFGEAVSISLGNSQADVSYQLKKDNVNVGSAIMGQPGELLGFQQVSEVGTYTVVATRGECTSTMTGSVVIAAPTLTVGTATQPSACPTGSIAFSSTCIAEGPQTLSYKKDNVAGTVSVTVAANGSFTLTNLSGGAYTDFAIGTTTATGNATLTQPYANNAEHYWIGCTNTDWHTATNWNKGTVPTAENDVVIPSDVANQPTIGAAAVAKSVEVKNSAVLTVSAAGQLTINGARTVQSKTVSLYNSGTFSNNGKLITGNESVANMGQFGVFSEGKVENKAGAEIHIDRSTLTGFFISGQTFNNYGKILIGQSAIPGANGINIFRTTLVNEANGEIRISRVGSYGIYNEAYFTNLGKIILQSAGSAILSSSGFENLGCSAVIDVQNNSTLILNGTSYNTGLIIERANGNSNIAQNDGVIQNLNGGTFSIGEGSGLLGTQVTNATQCSTGNGAIKIIGLKATTSYNISYTLNEGSAVSLTNQTSTAAGEITNINLAGGEYVITLSGSCLPVEVSLTATVTLPSYTLVTDTYSNPTTCSGTNGSVYFLTNLPSGTYTLVYKKDNAPQSTLITLGGVSGRIAAGAYTFTLSGLGAGEYKDFKITYNGCEAAAAGPVTLSEPNKPTVFNVTGGGVYCAGGMGVAVNLSGSQSHHTYQLKLGSDNVGTTQTGNGSAFSFVNQTDVGTYTIVATNTSTNCSATMTGSAVLTVIALPTAYNMTGGGAYCAGGTGVSITLSGSQNSTSYQLKRNGNPVGTPKTGNGSALTFGPEKFAAGTYTIEASVSGTTGSASINNSSARVAVDACTAPMNGSVVVTSIDPPIADAGANKTTCGQTPVALAAVTGVIADFLPESSRVRLGAGGGWSGGLGEFSNASSPTSTYTPAVSEVGTTVTLTWTVVGTPPCSNATDQMTVTVTRPNTTASLSVLGNATGCAGSTNTPKVVFTGAGGTAPYTFTYKINGGEAQTITTTSGNSVQLSHPTSTAGTFVYSLVSVVDAQGCNQPQSGTVTITIESPSAGGIIVYNNNPFCTNAGTATLTRTAPAGGTYSCDTPGLSLNATTGAVNLAASTPGTYLVKYTVVGTCVNMTTTASITVTAAPTATIAYANSPYCKGSGTASVTLTGKTGGVFSSTSGLSINANTGAIDLAASTAGTYVVTYTIAAANGCAELKTTANISITTAPAATIAYSGTPYCSNAGTASVTLTGSQGGTFSSTSGLSINANTGAIDLTASTAGTYVVTYTIASANGCSEFKTTGNVSITAAPTATIIYSSTPYCAGAGTASVTLTGKTGGVFSSTSGLSIDANTGAINLATSTAGTYVVTYTIAATNGCAELKTTANVSITTTPSATIAYANSPYCSNAGTASVTLTGSQGGTFSSTAGLSINANTGAIDLATSTSGTYVVTYTIAAANGCPEFKTTANVSITAAPTATIAYSNTPYCANAGTATVTLTGKTGGVFSSTSGLSIDANTGVIDLAASTAGTYVVTYTLAAANGCAELKTTANVSITTTPSATIAYANTPYCSNAGTASVTLTGSQGGTFSSTAGLSINANTGAIDLAASTAGSYVVTYTIAAANGCPEFKTTANVSITAAPTATIAYSNTPYCANAGTATVTLTGTTGGTFSSTSGLSINANTGVINLAASTAGNYVVTYTLAAANGCGELKTTANVSIRTTPSATIAYANTPYCSNAGTALVTLTGSQGGTFSSTAGLSINVATGEINLAASTAGTYLVIYTIPAANGCAEFKTTANVAITAASTATIAYSNSTYCATGTATVILTGATGGVFSSTTGLSINASTGAIDLGASTAGTYVVTYTIAAANGCPELKATTNVTVQSVLAAPVISSNQSSSVCMGTEVLLYTNCPQGSTVLWSNNSTATILALNANFPSEQTITVKCLGAGVCESPMSAAYTVKWSSTFSLTLINVGQSKSGIKEEGSPKSAWSSQFITPDAGPTIETSTEANPTIYFSENMNKTAPRYWTIHVETCNLGTGGSLTFNMLSKDEAGVERSYNTHENNAPYLMYANRNGFTELYAQNHPSYGFFQDNGSGGNVYDAGLPKGVYKLGIRYWDLKGWGSNFPATRKPQGNELAYQEFWFKIQSKDGIGVGAARVASDNGQRITDNGLFAEVMPNPVSSVLRLKVTEAKDQKVNVSLIDASGRTLLQRGFVAETNQHQEEFNVSELANGMYFLKVNAGDKQATLKVVKVQ